jgi:hypothetical protein
LVGVLTYGANFHEYFSEAHIIQPELCTQSVARPSFDAV